MTDNRDTFWKRLKGINAGMLGCADDWRYLPMSHYADPDLNALWFITARGTDLVTTLTSGPKEAMHVVSDGGEGLYARVHGRLSLSDDAAKLDELWNAVAASWFEDGQRDPDVQLVRMDLDRAEFWLTGGALSFLYQIAKSKVTGQKPDMGEHGEISFHG